MHVTLGRLSVAACAAAFVGCAGDNSQWTGSVTDSAGVAIVENTDEGLWSSAERWTLDEELRVGTVEGDPEYQFGQVGLLAVDSQDRIYVIDVLARNVRVYTADGQYERTIGGPGSGPGELGPQAGSVYLGPGDTVLVPDLGQQRVNRYAPDGTALGSFPIRLENGIPLAINVTRSGVIAEQIRPLALPNLPARDSMDAIITLGTDGTVLDTLMRFRPGGTLDLADPDDPRVTLFSAEPAWELAEDGRLYFGVNDNYRISVYAPDGTLERIFSKPFERSPITERDEEMIMSFVEQQIRDLVPPAQQEIALQRVRAAYRFAEFYPAFAGIQDGPHGTIWVQHIQSPSSVGEDQEWNPLEDIGARDWDVFDGEGRYLGVITMPPRFAPRLVSGDKLYGVWRDDLDVQYVVRLHIEGAAGAD